MTAPPTLKYILKLICVKLTLTACNAEEGIYPGVEVLTAYSKLGGCQFIIGLLGTAAGVVTVSLSASNVSWLFVNGLPFLSGVLVRRPYSNMFGIAHIVCYVCLVFLYYQYMN